jgi:hypothetical protein
LRRSRKARISFLDVLGTAHDALVAGLEVEQAFEREVRTLVDRGLGGAVREGRPAGEAFGELVRGVGELAGRDHPVHEAEAKRLLRIDQVAGEERLERLRRADLLVQQAGGTAVGSEPDPGEDDAEARRVGGDPQVRREREAAADSHGVAIDAAEDGLPQRPHSADAAAAAIEDVAACVARDRRRLAAAALFPRDRLQVGPGGEGEARSSENCDADAVVGLDLEERALELEEEDGRQRVARRGTVQRERRHAISRLEEKGGSVSCLPGLVIARCRSRRPAASARRVPSAPSGARPPRAISP